MAIDLDLDSARATLNDLFEEIQQRILQGTMPPISDALALPFETIFTTPIQSYREALLGIVLARLQDKNINLRLPYVNQGPTAYHARDLDERVVNPFLHQHRIPASRGPFLAMFRRGFKFDAAHREGQKNKIAYDAFLTLIAALEGVTEEAEINAFAGYLLYKFAKLREAAEVPLSRLQRISLEQFESLITSLLNTPSGGRLPVIIVVAALRAIKEYFGVDWSIGYQDINVADAASGVGGDITITQEGKIVFAAEVTERPVERPRVVTTFNTKIAPHGIEDYLFFVPLEKLSHEARRQGKQYFAQGHEINFLEIKDWVLMALATMGKRGRDLFNNHLFALLDDASIPRGLKVAWNEYITALTNG